MLKNILRALRLPFLSASVLAFVFGSLIDTQDFNLPAFLFGIACVICVHLSSNLINDYADSKSGADWQDRNFYKFFGGSKLIQEKIFSEKFYLRTALLFLLLSWLCVLMLGLILKSVLAAFFYLAIVFLGWSYSERPLRLCYRRLGEIAVFILFGPAPVMGGYFIQTGIFPDLKSFILSLPWGFFTAAILFANEVPDFYDDVKATKFTAVSLLGPSRAFLGYYLLVILAFLSLLLGIVFGYLNPAAFFSFLLIFLAAKAAGILKKYPQDKTRLMASSKLTILLHTLAGIILIFSVIS